MNIYQKKLTRASKLFGVYYELCWSKKSEESFNWYRGQKKLLLREDNINNIQGIVKEINLYPDGIKELIEEVYCKKIGVNKLTDCERELAIALSYKKYSKPYRTKKQYKRLKKTNK